MQRVLEIGLLRTFVMLVEERSVTRVARRLHRTQPAISLQIRRLEDAVERPLFESNLRHIRLTAHGEMLLPYARNLLTTHDEVHSRLSADEVNGRVTLGCPDIYAAFILPRTLASFRQAYPKVEVTVVCALTKELARAIDECRVDVAVATRMPGVAPRDGLVCKLRTEPLVWQGAKGGSASRQETLPLALLSEGNLHRDLALNSLHQAGRPWRITCTSDSISGLQAVALSDSAIIVTAQSVQTEGLEILGDRSGLPPLPAVELMLWRRRSDVSVAAKRLAEEIERTARAPA
ncbi:LysR family transcriptional regulator [Bradyrhizobium lablabi]|uniref:LysR substrate-binding domain-containing protein n=1 Tax=Bradyrhizobium lablabi TaxID=722472 RepID=UPI001BA6C432|nr:LysR substrate-binding domain-containing protein [Bradyrhizobium lablabi]MBR1121021.1 LysR family transcriptional regulator [Bradyrhizobium lablabi]